MHHYFQGKNPLKQAHKAIPENHIEEEQGLSGFFGPVSHLVKKKPSTRWVNIKGNLKPRMYDTVKFSDASSEAYNWKRMFFNNSMGIYFLNLNKGFSHSALRNADGDTIYFCHVGHGDIWTEYGLLSYSKGSYIVIPKCLTHYFVSKEASKFLVIENKTSHYQEPDRGITGRNALYDMQTLGRPDLDKLNKEIESSKKNIVSIQVKHNDELTEYEYSESIFDVVSWKGDLFPFTLHMDDIMPIMSHRAHLPPSAHSTFIARDFVVCSFLPRPLETDEDALKVPFYHQNIDYDEILFYHDGDFFSRDNLHAGMLSYHPAGFPHGPHPKARKSINTKTHTNEYAVMIDSRWPLKRDPDISNLELTEYWTSWMEREPLR
jgi:homogentisate 1,2-dioxygenase